MTHAALAAAWLVGTSAWRICWHCSPCRASWWAKAACSWQRCSCRQTARMVQRLQGSQQRLQNATSSVSSSKCGRAAAVLLMDWHSTASARTHCGVFDELARCTWRHGLAYSAMAADLKCATALRRDTARLHEAHEQMFANVGLVMTTLRHEQRLGVKFLQASTRSEPPGL